MTDEAFPNNPKFEVDAIAVSWPNRTPRVFQELWLLDDNRALLKTFIDTGGDTTENVEDAMLRTSPNAP